MSITIYEALHTGDPRDAIMHLRDVVARAGSRAFPKANEMRPGSTGGTFTAWIKKDGIWQPSGIKFPVGIVTDSEKRTAGESHALYSYHSEKKLRVLALSRDTNFFVASSQLADMEQEDPYACTYPGGIVCDLQDLMFAFSGLPHQWDEVVVVDVAYSFGAISVDRIRRIAELNENEQLLLYCRNVLGVDL